MKIMKESKSREKNYGLILDESLFEISNETISEEKENSVSSEANESLSEDIIEEQLEESINEDIEVEIQPAPEEGPKAGLASLLNTAIQDEWKTVDLYNSISITASSEGYDDIAKVIDEISTEESKHIGQLQAALSTIAPATEAIKAGEQEGAEQLNETQPEITEAE